MGRPRRWIPHVLRPDEKAAGTVFREVWGSSRTPDRIRKEYQMFLALNKLENGEESKVSVVGQF